MDKERLLLFLREQAEKPHTVGELEIVLERQSTEEFEELVRNLNELEQAGYVLRTRAKRYGLPERMNVIRGKIQGNARGFAFLLPDDKEHQDVFISEDALNGAMNGDIVLVRMNKKNNGPRIEGEVIRIIERAVTSVVGTFQDLETYGFCVPDDKRLHQDIFIPKEHFNGAAEGHKVVVELVRYPEGRRNAEGIIVSILGHKNDPGVDILSIIHKYNLSEGFPQDVMQEAEQVADDIEDVELANRRDLREETIVTIDGADAKDLDDAISLKMLANGHYELGVHIADVSHYVQEGSALDEEAYKRGTSVYLVDRVIPMLPHRLSNGICSLNPQVDRLTLSCTMEITPKGDIIGHDLFPSVIRTTERMTYTDVYRIVDRDVDDADSGMAATDKSESDEAANDQAANDQVAIDETIKRYESLVPFFDKMKELALVLRQKRFGRGAIDFDFKEAKVMVDEEGVPLDVELRERSIAEKIIEEFMLAANETVAEHFHWLKVPFIYRIHEDPKQEKLQTFLEFSANFGHVLKGTSSNIHPSSLQKLLDQIRDTPEETVISRVMLRSMQQARYSEESVGHFGLATKFYTHFTSPIRRYPDLIVHRLMRKYAFDKDLSEKTQDHWKGLLPSMAEHTSNRERQAVDAERETDDLKKAEYMLDKIDQEFAGIISGVTSFGLFVELENTVEGLVHVSFMTDDYYHFHEKAYAMVGERTGQVLRLGDEVVVRVTKVSLDERSIDFELVESKGTFTKEDLPAEQGQSGKPGRSGQSSRPGKPDRLGKPKQSGKPGRGGKAGKLKSPGKSKSSGNSGWGGKSGKPGQSGKPGKAGFSKPGGKSKRRRSSKRG